MRPTSTPRKPNGRRSPDRSAGSRNSEDRTMTASRTARWIVAVATVALAIPAVAQDYPVRPITLGVPYTPGGGNDAMARVVADRMSAALGQQIVIENRGGAGGSIATRQVARAEPDGYTLGLGGTGTLAIDPTLYPNVGYDPRKDFAPVGLIATSALAVLVNPAVPAKTIAELIALAKREPGKLNYARAGAHRSGRRPCGDLFQLAAAGDRPGQGRQGARARRHRAGALEDLSRAADRRRVRAARLRGRSALRHRGAGRHPQADRGQARGGPSGRYRVARHAGAHRHRRRRGHGHDAGRIRRRH